MTPSIARKIVHIDEEKCNGCGLCIPSCAEGALQLINGKARIVNEKYCDGLGACLGECPRGAISIEERIAEDFDEEAATNHLAEERNRGGKSAYSSNVVPQFKQVEVDKEYVQSSMLAHWPVQLTLVSPAAPFLQNADVILAAHCVPFAYANFHRDFLNGHSLLIACPKLDDFQAHLSKLTEVFRKSNIKSLTIIHMEVPCCSGLIFMVNEALKQSGRTIPLNEVTIGVKGEIQMVE